MPMLANLVADECKHAFDKLRPKLVLVEAVSPEGYFEKDTSGCICCAEFACSLRKEAEERKTPVVAVKAGFTDKNSGGSCALRILHHFVHGSSLPSAVKEKAKNA
jgi:hypothetical protein